MITLRNISLRRGPNLLLDDINWTIYHKQHIGIIGTNGSGKSSFFSMLLHEIQADSGELEIPTQLKFAHLAQETPAYDKSALDFVLDGDAELRILEQELLDAEQKGDGDHIAALHCRFSEIDGYTAPARAAQLLDGLGFSQQEQQQPVADFSGGWRMRLNLAKTLICRSDVLLLDEPTNHLDLDTTLWLQSWLVRYPGTLLLISHDRDFLDCVVDHVAHLYQKQLTIYAGNYSDFEKQRATNLLVQQAAYGKQQKQIAHMKSFVDRFKAKASKARQAQSRLKAIERMELVSAVHADSPLQFSFREPQKCTNPLISLRNAHIGYGEKTILTHVNLSITTQDRIALIGPNGAGKSSLIKTLMGDLALHDGDREAGSGLKIGYFAQHQIDHLRLNETPLDHLKKLSENGTERELRGFLGSFGFSGNRALESIKNFSGGEKSRLALALLVWQRPNLLLLDEPTNHLDLDMRHALSMALQDYQGAMILVSHDRFLVRSTVDQLVLVADGKAAVFDGDLNDYEKWLFEFRRKKEKLIASQTKKSEEKNVKPRHSHRQLLQNIKKYETDLGKLQKQATAIEISLTDLSLYEEKNKSQLQEHLVKQANINEQLKNAENSWLQACAALEEANKTES